MHYAHQHLDEQPSHSAPLPDVYIVVSNLKQCSSTEFAGRGSMFCFIMQLPGGGSGLEFVFVFVSIVFAFAGYEMWNVAMVVFPQTRCEFISFEKESCF